MNTNTETAEPSAHAETEEDFPPKASELLFGAMVFWTIVVCKICLILSICGIFPAWVWKLSLAVLIVAITVLVAKALGRRATWYLNHYDDN